MFGVYLTPSQAKVAELLLVPPYRVLVPSANEQGKTFLGAVISIWWHLTRKPSIILTTAPTREQVRDLLWKEIRRLSSGLPMKFAGPTSLRVERSADDFMKGYTSRDATSIQGHHGPSLLFLFDESTKIRGDFFEATEGMFSPPGHAWLVFLNPTDTTAEVYRQYKLAGRYKSWHVVRMSALQHPNVNAELAGQPPVVKHAMRIDKLERLIYQWCQLLRDDETPKATDIQWPPAHAVEYCNRTGQKPRWFRRGPIAEARLFALFPSQAVNSVWSDGDWQAAIRENLPPIKLQPEWEVEFGCDVARFGLDWTAFHVRCGDVSLHPEEYNGQDTAVTSMRLIELAKKWATWQRDRTGIRCDPTTIPIKVDDDGIGGAVCDILRMHGYNAIRIVASTKAIARKDYPNRRSELWFLLPERARLGEIDLSALRPETLERMQTQALAAKYTFNSHGQRVVTPKDEIREELGCSPDAMDAVNLAYAPTVGEGTGPVVGNVKGEKEVQMRY